MQRRFALACLTAMQLSGSSVLGLAPPASVPAAEVIGSSLYSQPWTWTEDSGRQVSLSAWRGQLVFLSMAYSSCRNTCAMTFHTLDLLQSRLDRDGRVAQMVVVSYDPKNDTAAAWAAFRRRRHLERPNWHFLSGDPQTTRPSMDLALYREVVERIRASGTDVLINLTTGPGARFIPG